ncbi:MAG: hypothetical protein ABI183_04890 [Polyangiaceae bacterium]
MGSLFAIAAVFPVTMMLVEGCGSDSFTAAPSTDGGNEGATTDAAALQDGSGPTLDGCVKAPTASDPTLQPFCDAFAEISSRCNDCDPCRQANANSCEAFGSALSAAMQRGVVACKDQIECSQFESQSGLPSNPCVAAYIVDAGPTPAQVSAATAYCGNCPAAADSGVDYCDSYFGGGDAGGIGGITLVSSDAIAAKIAQNCNGCLPADYVLICSLELEFCPVATKNHCPNSGLCQ